MYLRSKWSMNIFALDGAQIVPIAQPLICRKCFELNIKSFKVRMRAKKVDITFAAIVFFEKFSWNTFTAFKQMPTFNVLLKNICKMKTLNLFKITICIKL